MSRTYLSTCTLTSSRLGAWATAALAAGMVIACGGGDEGGAGAGGNASGGQGGAVSTGGGGSSSGEGGDLPVHPGVLVDEGLVARYYLDEAASGQDPTEALDAAPDPLPLALTYINEGTDTFMTYTEDPNGNRGLTFATYGRDDRASVAIDGTKISTSLHSSTTMTYEVVAEVLGVIPESSRLIHIGLDTDHTLSFETGVVTRLGFEVNDGGWTSVPSYLPALGRAVFHSVFDSSQADPLDRVRIYVNGGRLPIIGDVAVEMDAAIDLGPGRHFVIGNREIGQRTIEGTIYYAAVYSDALSEAQVLQNVGLLLVDDDTPGG